MERLINMLSDLADKYKFTDEEINNLQSTIEDIYYNDDESKDEVDE